MSAIWSEADDRAFRRPLPLPGHWLFWGSGRPALLSLLVRIGVTAVGHARHQEPGVLLLGHRGQLFKKADRCPDFLVTMIAPGRHAGHFDAVLDDPEQLGRTVGLHGFCQVRRRWIKAAPDIAFRHAWRAMANRAMCRIMLEAHYDLRRIVELGWC